MRSHRLSFRHPGIPNLPDVRIPHIFLQLLLCCFCYWSALSHKPLPALQPHLHGIVRSYCCFPALPRSLRIVMELTFSSLASSSTCTLPFSLISFNDHGLSFCRKHIIPSCLMPDLLPAVLFILPIYKNHTNSVSIVSDISYSEYCFFIYSTNDFLKSFPVSECIVHNKITIKCTGSLCSDITHENSSRAHLRVQIFQCIDGYQR